MGRQAIAIVTIFVLIILLIFAIGYILINGYQQRQLQNQISIYQQGAQAGYEQAVVELVQQVATCQPVPIRVVNQTINVIAVDCLSPSGTGNPTMLSDESG